jgi:hypothetical protein
MIFGADSGEGNSFILVGNDDVSLTVNGITSDVK